MWEHYEQLVNVLLKRSGHRGTLQLPPAIISDCQTGPITCSGSPGTQTWRHICGDKWVKLISSLKGAWVRAGHLNSDSKLERNGIVQRGLSPSREELLRQRNLIGSHRVSHTLISP